MASVVVCCDATHDNISHLPKGQAAGYTTGSGGVAWTGADWKGRPSAVRIDQTPAHTVWDATADVDDYERGAVTLAELAPRAKLRLAAFRQGTRPGQRAPAVYFSRADVHKVVDALIAGGVTSGVGLWIADWDNDQAGAAAEVAKASGPFPVIGRQFRNAGLYDVSVMSASWLAVVSAKKPGGPYRHVADGTQSLAQIAAARHTTVQHLVEVTAGAATPADLAAIAAALAAAGHVPLPKGAVWYSTNP